MGNNIDALILRIDALQAKVFGTEPSNISPACSSSLSEKLCKLEQELDSEQKDKSLPARISGL
eukprot:9431493-Ditylum_brightwellii.AAC.1